MYNSKIVCITGPDGSGKSTLINQLLHQYPNSKKIGIWDAFTLDKNKIFINKSSIDDYLCGLSSIARTFFLTHALLESMKNIAKSESSIVFFDSYFYKYYSSELALGTPLHIIKSLEQYFVKPDLVISLNCKVETCASRKNTFTRYECGLIDQPNEHTFINFQNKCSQNWIHFQQENWIHVNAENTPEYLLKTTIKNINILCK